MSEAALGARHQRVQRLRRLAQRASVRRAEGAFVAEGAKLLESALEAGASIEAVFHAPTAEISPGELALIDRARDEGIHVHLLAPGVIERVADTVSPQPLCFVAERRTVEVEVALAHDLVAVLVDVRDPGNIGAILRSADAAGIGALLATRGTGDLFNPKAVRASAGSLFHLPIADGAALDDVVAALGRSGHERVATDVAHGEDYTDAYRERVALFLGNEANGLPDELEGRLERKVHIPVAGGAESLNVAMAATVLFFELARQRREPGRARPSMSR